MKEFEFIEHPAEIKFVAYGKTKEHALQNVIFALSHFISRGQKIKELEKKIVDVDGVDTENMLYNLIEDVLFLFEVEKFLVARAKISIEGKKLHAELSGDDSTKYEGLDHVKAATYSEMKVVKTKKGWEAHVVLDV